MLAVPRKTKRAPRRRHAKANRPPRIEAQWLTRQFEEPSCVLCCFRQAIAYVHHVVVSITRRVRSRITRSTDVGGCRPATGRRSLLQPSPHGRRRREPLIPPLSSANTRCDVTANPRRRWIDHEFEVVGSSSPYHRIRPFRDRRPGWLAGSLATTASTAQKYVSGVGRAGRAGVVADPRRRGMGGARALPG